MFAEAHEQVNDIVAEVHAEKDGLATKEPQGKARPAA